MTSYVIVVSSGYASSIHGLWREDAARETADRWNRAFAKRGIRLTAYPQPLRGKTARARDIVGEMLAEMAEHSAADAAAHVGCEGCPDCDPDGTLAEDADAA